MHRLPVNPASEIVRRKRAAAGEAAQPPAPFHGWHSRGYLPHCDAPGEIQFLTWRQADSLPAEVLAEIAALRRAGKRREALRCGELWLDRGVGCCRLQDPRAAELVEGALQHFDLRRYRLCAWVVMPNHVHVLFETLNEPLAEILASWKKFTALRLNRLFQQQGQFWQEDYWDTFMRDEPHFWRTVRYIEDNPVKARLVREPAAWPFSSANPKWRWEEGKEFSRWHGARLLNPVSRAAPGRALHAAPGARLSEPQDPPSSAPARTAPPAGLQPTPGKKMTSLTGGSESRAPENSQSRMRS